MKARNIGQIVEVIRAILCLRVSPMIIESKGEVLEVFLFCFIGKLTLCLTVIAESILNVTSIVLVNLRKT